MKTPKDTTTQVKLTPEGKRLDQMINGPKTRRNYSYLAKLLGHACVGYLHNQERIEARVLVGKASRKSRVDPSKMLNRLIHKQIIEEVL